MSNKETSFYAPMLILCIKFAEIHFIIIIVIDSYGKVKRISIQNFFIFISLPVFKKIISVFYFRYHAVPVFISKIWTYAFIFIGYAIDKRFNSFIKRQFIPICIILYFIENFIIIELKYNAFCTIAVSAVRIIVVNDTSV